MNSHNEFIYFLSFFIFVFTFAFSYSYKLFSKSKISSYTKCLAGGVILSTMIFHIFPDLYETRESLVGPFFSGVSFLILFSVDKLYLNAMEHEHDSLPLGITQTQALIFVIALSLHSFLEGMGIPTKTGKDLYWYTLGLIGHKWAEAFALGVSIITSSFSKRAVFYLLLIYSVLTPLGSLFGVFLIETLRESSKFECVKQFMIGISSGSFFYIGFIEMLNSEFHYSATELAKRKNRTKLFSIISGFTLMTLVIFICSKIEGLSA